MEVTVTKPSGSGKTYLRFAEEEWNEDGEVVANKVGFVQVKADKAEELKAKYVSGEKKRVFGVQNNLGNYEMVLVGASNTVAATAETIEHEA